MYNDFSLEPFFLSHIAKHSSSEAENPKKMMPKRTLQKNILLPEATYSCGESSVVSKRNEAHPLLCQIWRATQ